MILTSEINSFYFLMSWGNEEQLGWGNLEPLRLTTITDFDEIFSMYKTYLNVQKGFLNCQYRLRQKKFKKRPLLLFFDIPTNCNFFSNAQEEEFEKYIR